MHRLRRRQFDMRGRAARTVDPVLRRLLPRAERPAGMMDRRVLILAAGVAAMLGGAWLIGVVMFGVVLMLLGGGAAYVALFVAGDPAGMPQAKTLQDILDRVRDAA